MSAEKSAAQKQADVDLLKILDKAAKSAFRGGVAGAAAMGVNVFALMWMRTTINYQYRYGTSMMTALRTLYADGGILRFYRGVGFALVQGPWSRFGDTAANTGALELMNAFEVTKDMNSSVKTLGASAAAAVFRMGSTPIDTCKTIMQVEGRTGLTKLYQKYSLAGGFPRGLPQLWHGAYGTVGATFVGHYPWFATYNTLQEKMPKAGYVAALSLPVSEKHAPLIDKLVKNATIGFAASAVSDTCSNSIRVVKVRRGARCQAAAPGGCAVLGGLIREREGALCSAASHGRFSGEVDGPHARCAALVARLSCRARLGLLAGVQADAHGQHELPRRAAPRAQGRRRDWAHVPRARHEGERGRARRAPLAGCRCPSAALRSRVGAARAVLSERSTDSEHSARSPDTHSLPSPYPLSCRARAARPACLARLPAPVSAFRSSRTACRACSSPCSGS